MTTILKVNNKVYTDSLMSIHSDDQLISLSRTDLGPKFFLLPEKTALVTSTGFLDNTDLLNLLLGHVRLVMYQLNATGVIEEEQKFMAMDLEQSIAFSQTGKFIAHTPTHEIVISSVPGAFRLKRAGCKVRKHEDGHTVYGSGRSGSTYSVYFQDIMSRPQSDDEVVRHFRNLIDGDMLSGGDINIFDLNQLKPMTEGV